MPDPTPFPNRRAPRPAPIEADADRRARQLAYFRELAELNMQAARIAAAKIEANALSDDPADTASPTLDLARATRAVTLVVNHENRVVHGEPGPASRAALSDPRRAQLRKPLHGILPAVPQSERATLRRLLDHAIEQALAEDPAAETPLIDHLMAITDEFGIELDPAHLSDEILGMDDEPTDPDPNAPPGDDPGD